MCSSASPCSGIDDEDDNFNDLVKNGEYDGSDLESKHEGDEERIGCQQHPTLLNIIINTIAIAIIIIIIVIINIIIIAIINIINNITNMSVMNST